MSKEIYISSTPHETRLAIVENDNLAEMYYERENEYTLAGSIYNGKVTRVLPGMQSSFVDIGLERDAFLYITDFMEEAGDTADFEASSGDPGRSRSSAGRDHGSRQSRDLQPRTAEPSDSELFTEAVSGLDRSRPATLEGQRPDRGQDRSQDRSPDRGSSDRGRRGGRNRGNRGANRSAQARPDQLPAEPSVPDHLSLQDEFAAEPIAGNIAIPDQTDAVGEGLPGADGSRRWRGRRGRRGNRNPNAAAETLSGSETGTGTLASPVLPESQPHRETGPVYDAYGAPDIYSTGSEDDDLSPHIDLHAETSTLPVPPVQSAPNDRTERGGRDRGRGNRDRDGRDKRDNRSDRPAPAPRVPRGFAPSTSLYKVDSSETTYGVEPELEAPSEPIILPGESLSKYKAGASASIAAKPSEPAVDTFVAKGWDGGFVLPGETLRPRNTSQPHSDTASRSGRDRDGRDRPDRSDRSDRHGRDDRKPRENRESRRDFPREQHIVTPLAATPAPATPTAPEPTYLTEPDHVSPSHLITTIHSTFVPPPPVPHLHHTEPEPAAFTEAPAIGENAITAAAPEAAPLPEPAEELEFEETPHEYEPLEASASYRVDPLPPQEFRQASAVLEPELDQDPQPELAHEPEPEPAHESVPEPEFVAAVEVLAELHSDTPHETHELTSLTDTGHLHSSPAAESLHNLSPQDELAPSSPIAHESAVVEPSETGPASAPQHFQPGSGILEEEMLDDGDDEVDGIVPALHAHTQLDFEQAEQESIEHGADLGVMLREMSIDQITRTEHNLDHEDLDEQEEDFDEDFIEEDQDLGSEDPEESEESSFTSGEQGDESEAEEASLHTHHSDEFGADLPESHSGSEPEFASSEPRAEALGRALDKGTDTTRDSGRSRRDFRPDRSRRSHSGDRSNSGSSSGFDRSRGDKGHRGRPSMQSTNLPAISDLLKPGQEILVQIAKEPIAKKGARITSHIALPGRFLVFMPTVSHTGVSRKIESDSERRRLKEILLSEKGDASGGFIVRTAASGATEQELRSDLRFLLNLWADIKSRSESSKSPALIYHDLNLIERVLRDQVTDNFSAIWVDSETEYERVLRFLQRFQPSLIRRVKLYTKETPLFEQFGITEEINKALRSKVWLKSGGSIVINQTEALVAIDINTGKFVGKTARLEDTIVKTNLDAIPEIVRQIRLRDLGGIIIIDFIDMDERKNRNKVMAALEEELKSDRAPSKVLQFNDFGLVAITRKRVKQSLERTLSTTCNVCQGTGMTKSPVTICNDIYVEMRKMSKHLDRGDVMLRVHPEVVKQLKAPSTHWLQEMEEMVGKTILIKSDPSLHPEQFDIH